MVPNSGPTVASRTAMVVGRMVEMAARSIKRTLVDAGLLAEPYSAAAFKAACRVRGVARRPPRLEPLRAAARHPLG
jgi:hypothetical protein